jgi:hypothetical protein
LDCGQLYNVVEQINRIYTLEIDLDCTAEIYGEHIIEAIAGNPEEFREKIDWLLAQGFGDTTVYEDAGCVWANVTWSKGVKALHEGALDAYDTVLFRMRWNTLVKRDSQLVYEGVVYQIISFHADRLDNTIQITAQEIVK